MAKTPKVKVATIDRPPDLGVGFLCDDLVFGTSMIFTLYRIKPVMMTDSKKSPPAKSKWFKSAEL